MDDSLQSRLDSVERRQRIVIALLVVPYLITGADLLWSVVLTDPGWLFIGLLLFVALALGGLGYVGYRGRRSSRQ
ncbi:hypothetical protein [Halobaculum limi]|uniref:hypothetical protein n=1 Tax=Halobaculum limi TaxID=3031916 RepID=UPI0024058EF7|nr:hypothetical protein [Halobaculum sp. YSMS11]